MSENSIEFSLSIAEQRAVGFIPAWSLAFLQGHLGKKPDTLTQRPDLYPTKETQSPESANLYNYCPLFT